MSNGSVGKQYLHVPEVFRRSLIELLVANISAVGWEQRLCRTVRRLLLLLKGLV